jgi:thioredoxin-like negative regulator of GroEL
MKVLRFTAVWCEPCKMLAKNLDNVTTQVPIQVLDIDKEEDLARHFNVRSVPTLVMIDEDKKEVKRVVGVQSVKQLNQFINE